MRLARFVARANQSALEKSMFPILKMRGTGGYYGASPNTIGTLARVSKTTARKLYDKDYELIVVPHKMMPFFRADSFAMRMNKTAEVTPGSSVRSFDIFVSYYTNANCSWDVGYYPAFYVQYNHYVEKPAYSGKFFAE